MAVRIEYNKAFEFVNAIMKYASVVIEDEWKSSATTSVDKNGKTIKHMIDFTPSVFIQNWIRSVSATISTFIKNDTHLLFNRFTLITVILHGFIIDKNIKEPIQLIEGLKLFTAEEILSGISEYLDAPVAIRNNPEAIQEYVRDNWGDEVAEIYSQLTRHPEEFIEKLISILDYFYHIHFKPIEADLDAFIAPKLKEHRKLLEKDPLHFLNVIGIGDYKAYIDSNYPITLYLSYIVDIGMFYYTYRDTLYMVYGISMEQRFDQVLMQEKCKNLFKALSDDKRIEIIKLTSKRPYYGKELAVHFGLTPATLSYHLNLLLDIGILNFEPQPNNRFFYTANLDVLKASFKTSLEMLLK